MQPEICNYHKKKQNHSLRNRSITRKRGLSTSIQCDTGSNGTRYWILYWIHIKSNMECLFCYWMLNEAFWANRSCESRTDSIDTSVFQETAHRQAFGPDFQHMSDQNWPRFYYRINSGSAERICANEKWIWKQESCQPKVANLSSFCCKLNATWHETALISSACRLTKIISNNNNVP